MTAKTPIPAPLQAAFERMYVAEVQWKSAHITGADSGRISSLADSAFRKLYRKYTWRDAQEADRAAARQKGPLKP